MEFFLTLSNSWKVIYNGFIKTIFGFLEFTIPELISSIFGETPFYDIVYETIYNLLSEIPIGDLNLADISFFSMMFGVGVGFVIVYSLIKWLSPDLLN